MEEKYYITKEEVAELKRVTDAMPHGIKVGRMVRNIKYDAKDIKIEAYFKEQGELPGLDELLIKINTHFHLVKSFVKTTWEKWKKEAIDEDLNYYIDEAGREFIIENGTKIYFDPRGFEYFIGVHATTNRKVEQLFLDNGQIGTFINPERTLLEIEGKVYSMDERGKIALEENVDYINFHR